MASLKHSLGQLQANHQGVTKMSKSCSCHDNHEHYYEQACEFIIPVKLIVPIFLEPKVFVKPTCVRESFQVHLEPEIYLEPEVRAQPPKCISQGGCYQEALAATES